MTQLLMYSPDSPVVGWIPISLFKKDESLIRVSAPWVDAPKRFYKQEQLST